MNNYRIEFDIFKEKTDDAFSIMTATDILQYYIDRNLIINIISNNYFYLSSNKDLYIKKENTKENCDLFLKSLLGNDYIELILEKITADSEDNYYFDFHMTENDAIYFSLLYNIHEFVKEIT